MEAIKIREIWRVWKTSYDSSTDLTERCVASDILELIRDLVEEKVVVACLRDPTTNPDVVLKSILGEIGIRRKQWDEGGRNENDR